MARTGRPLKRTTCPRYPHCLKDTMLLSKSARHKHVKQCLEKQKSENAFLINVDRFALLNEVNSNKHIENTNLADTRFDYKKLLEVVKVKLGRAKSRIVFLTKWKDSINDAADFQGWKDV